MASDGRLSYSIAFGILGLPGGKPVRVLVLLSCLFYIPIAAASAAKHAPVPDAVLHAKTVYILNETGMQQIADAAYADLEKWGRFSIVSDRRSADLIIHFVSRDVLREGTSRPEVSMFVTTPESDDPLYQDTSRPHFTWSAVVNSNITHFRKWVEGK
jgi:hypothetical protein